MKKTLSLILAVMMLLGCTGLTAFAADNEATISAEITAADFGYTMVIPTSTTLTEAKHENVLLGTTAAADGDGIVSIKDIKHPTDKVNVYYTVDLTNGNLTDGTNTIAATYKYKQGENAFAAIDGTTKVTVYANKTVTNSLVNVTADDTQWKAAPTGTYNATVVFNFAEEDASIKYMDWDSTNKKLVEKSTKDFTEVTSSTTTLEAGKFYVVNGEVSTAGLVVNGTAAEPTTLILADGAQLTVTGSESCAGINVAKDKAIVITGQSGGTGVLNVTGGVYGAGIGGNDCRDGGTVNINGGTVTAKGGNAAAGIGGGEYGNGGTVNINGGTVTAIAGDNAKAIGAGCDGAGPGNPGTVNFGSGNFTVKAGDAAPGTDMTTDAYKNDHSAAYVHIEEVK